MVHVLCVHWSQLSRWRADFFGLACCNSQRENESALGSKNVAAKEQSDHGEVEIVFQSFGWGMGNSFFIYLIVMARSSVE